MPDLGIKRRLKSELYSTLLAASGNIYAINHYTYEVCLIMFTCNKTMWKKGVRESRVRGGPLVATEGNTSGGPEPTEDKVYRELLAYIAALPQGHVTTSPIPQGHVTSSQATKVCDCLFHGGPPEHFQTQRFLRGNHGKNHESVLTHLAARLFGFPPRHPVGCLGLLPDILSVTWVSSQTEGRVLY